MDETLITWNAPNMITIWLMALVGGLVLMLAAQLYHNGKSSS